MSSGLDRFKKRRIRNLLKCAEQIEALAGPGGEALVQFAFSVMQDETAKTSDRLDAMKWLDSRLHGKEAVNVEMTGKVAHLHGHIDLRNTVSKATDDDLNVIEAIFTRLVTEEPAAIGDGEGGESPSEPA